MRVSVMDVRSAPEWTAWAEWIGCETCGNGKTRSRTKTCECATPPCFPCPGGPCNATDTNPGQCEADQGIGQKNVFILIVYHLEYISPVGLNLRYLKAD